jgi:hypothetical protein
MDNGDDDACYLFKGYDVVATEADPALSVEAEWRVGDALRLAGLRSSTLPWRNGCQLRNSQKRGKNEKVHAPGWFDLHASIAEF